MSTTNFELQLNLECINGMFAINKWRINHELMLQRAGSLFFRFYNSCFWRKATIITQYQVLFDLNMFPTLTEMPAQVALNPIISNGYNLQPLFDLCFILS